MRSKFVSHEEVRLECARRVEDGAEKLRDEHRLVLELTGGDSATWIPERAGWLVRIPLGAAPAGPASSFRRAAGMPGKESR